MRGKPYDKAPVPLGKCLCVTKPQGERLWPVNLYTKINLPSIVSLFSKTYLTLGGQVPRRYASGYASLGWLAGLAWLPSDLKHSFVVKRN